jgi:hypothetical protein
MVMVHGEWISDGGGNDKIFGAREAVASRHIVFRLFSPNTSSRHFRPPLLRHRIPASQTS